MRTVLLVFELLLLVWFFGCIVTYRVGGRVLVDGMGVRSAEFVMLTLYVASIVLSLRFPAFGQWIVVGVLSFWIVIQFFCHWYYTLFGASEAKLKGYNRCFQNTIRLFPPSDRRLIPDLYHIVLHALLLLNLALSLFVLLASL